MFGTAAACSTPPARCPADARPCSVADRRGRSIGPSGAIWKIILRRRMIFPKRRSAMLVKARMLGRAQCCSGIGARLLDRLNVRHGNEGIMRPKERPRDPLLSMPATAGSVRFESLGRSTPAKGPVTMRFGLCRDGEIGGETVRPECDVESTGGNLAEPPTLTLITSLPDWNLITPILPRPSWRLFSAAVSKPARVCAACCHRFQEVITKVEPRDPPVPGGRVPSAVEVQCRQRIGLARFLRSVLDALGKQDIACARPEDSEFHRRRKAVDELRIG